jgi:hypothetical protein
MPALIEWSLSSQDKGDIPMRLNKGIPVRIVDGSIILIAIDITDEGGLNDKICRQRY